LKFSFINLLDIEVGTGRFVCIQTPSCSAVEFKLKRLGMNSRISVLTGTTLIWLASFAGFDAALAQTWTHSSAPNQNWEAIASSANGRNLVAAVYGGGIYFSTNYGGTWFASSSPTLNWYSVASSADGSRMVAVPFNTIPYTSTDSGATWFTNTAFGNDWHWVASTADGLRLFGAGYVGSLATSTNGGASWTRLTNAPATYWGCVAASADGSHLIAMINNFPTDTIYTSTNSGSTWATNNSPNQPWKGVASSADGTTLAAIWGGSSAFISTNAGGLWSSNYFSGGMDFVSVAMSASGSTIVAAATSISSGAIFTSTNSGMNWNSNGLSQLGSWKAVASSADGNRLVAASYGGGIWTSQRPPKPQLNIANVNGQAKLSWTVPSTNFVAQESTNLISWTDLTNTATLNLTNLQNELFLPLNKGSAFHRLKEL
jgi:hypothetical protein